MLLSIEDRKLFFKLNLGLLHFSGRIARVIPEDTDFRQFSKLDIQVKGECRKVLWENEYLIDEYIAYTGDDLTEAEIKILEGFKRKVSGDFVILKCLTNYAVFLNIESNGFYAVKALSDPFTHILPRFPAIVSEVVLLPFMGKIIYDGFFYPTEIYYGTNLKDAINAEYKEAKKNRAILEQIDV